MKKIDELLRNIPSEKTSANFTVNVMSEVFKVAEEERVQEQSLEQILHQQKAVKAPAGFAVNVMQNIYSPKTEKPIISKWGWAAIILVTIPFILYSLKNYSGGSFESLGLVDLNLSFDSVPVIYSLSVFSLGVLVYADYFLRKKLKV